MNASLLELLANPFMNLAQRLAWRVPSLIAAFLFLLAGLFMAKFLRMLAVRILDRTRMDEHAAKVGINEVLARLGLGRSPAYVVSFLVYWFILLAFIVSAANAADLTVVSELLERFMAFFPGVIAAILILFGGLLFARFLSEVVSNAAAANNIRGGEMLAKAVYVIILGFVSLMACEQLGLQVALISSGIQILFASLGLTFALAFGLGGKAVAEELIRDFLKKPDRPA